jgi:hypothetical protein
VRASSRHDLLARAARSWSPAGSRHLAQVNQPWPLPFGLRRSA